MIKLRNIINAGNAENSNEFETTNFDNPNGWNWKHVDHLIEMGFQLEGDTRFKLVDKKDFDETLNVEIYKEKTSKNYMMIVNGRKHVFNTFDKLIDFIDEKQIN